MLYSAVTTGNASYDPMGAYQLVFQDSRDDTNWYDFMLPEIGVFTREVVSIVGRKWAGMVLQNASDPTTLANIQASPQAVSPAIGFSEFNLRPFYPYTSIPAVNIDLICRYHILAWPVDYFMCNRLPVPKLAPPYDSPPCFLAIVCLTTYFHYLFPLPITDCKRCLQWQLWIIVVIILPPTSCIYRDSRATFTIKSLIQFPHTAKLASWHVQYLHYRQILYRSSRSLFASQSICSTSTPKAICLLNFGS